MICNRQEGRSYKALKSPPLPEFRVKEAPPFRYIGLDYLGGMDLFDHLLNSRAVHLEVVPNMTVTSLLRSFRRNQKGQEVRRLLIADEQLITNRIRDMNKF